MRRIKIKPCDKYIFETSIVVQIGDINYGGHLANDAILRIAHEARLRFLAKYKLSEMETFGTSLIMSDAAIEYRAESFWGEELQVAIGLDNLNAVGFDILYRILNKQTGTEVARIKTGMVFYDYSRKRITKTPEEFIAFFKSF